MQDVFYDEYDEPQAPKGVRAVVASALKWGSAALSLALVVAIVLWAYRLGIRDVTDIPVIRAADGPARVQPQDPGGTEVAHQGLEVNEILAGNAAQTPRAEALAPGDAALSEEDVPADPSALDVRGVEASEISAAIEDLLARDPDLAPAQEIAAAPLAALDPALPEVEPESTPSEAEAGLRPRLRPQGLAAVQATPAAAGPAPLSSVQPTAQPGAAAAVQVPLDANALPAGTRLVQVGAFDSQAQAESQWARLMSAHGDLLGTKQRIVQRADSNGRIFYRLRVAQFSDRNAQQAICEALRARSVDCIPVTVR